MGAETVWLSTFYKTSFCSTEERNHADLEWHKGEQIFLGGPTLLWSFFFPQYSKWLERKKHHSNSKSTNSYKKLHLFGKTNIKKPCLFTCVRVCAQLCLWSVVYFSYLSHVCLDLCLFARVFIDLSVWGRFWRAIFIMRCLDMAVISAAGCLAGFEGS